MSAETAHKAEIEITPAMLEAGISAVTQCLGPSPLYGSMTEAEMAIRVFSEMARTAGIASIVRSDVRTS